MFTLLSVCRTYVQHRKVVLVPYFVCSVLFGSPNGWIGRTWVERSWWVNCLQRGYKRGLKTWLFFLHPLFFIKAKILKRKRTKGKSAQHPAAPFETVEGVITRLAPPPPHQRYKLARIYSPFHAVIPHLIWGLFKTGTVGWVMFYTHCVFLCYGL